MFAIGCLKHMSGGFYTSCGSKSVPQRTLNTVRTQIPELLWHVTPIQEVTAEELGRPMIVQIFLVFIMIGFWHDLGSAKPSPDAFFWIHVTPVTPVLDRSIAADVPTAKVPLYFLNFMLWTFDFRWEISKDSPLCQSMVSIESKNNRRDTSHLFEVEDWEQRPPESSWSQESIVRSVETEGKQQQHQGQLFSRVGDAFRSRSLKSGKCHTN